MLHPCIFAPNLETFGTPSDKWHSNTFPRKCKLVVLVNQTQKMWYELLDYGEFVQEIAVMNWYTKPVTG